MSDTSSDESFARTYGFELLFEANPRIEISSAINELQQIIGEIDYKEGANQNLLFLVDHKVTYVGSEEVPAQLVLLHADPQKDEDKLTEEIQQSWQTPNAHEIVSSSKYKVLLTDLMASGLDLKERQFILSASLKIFVKHSNCIGVASKWSQQILDRENILSSNDQLFGFLNIRFFNAGDQGLIMDSLGLSALGLYDIQCHFVDLDPNEVSSQLYNIAYYIFNDEPEFENGHTVEGVNGEIWKIQYEKSLVSPNRTVLDLNPGPKFSIRN